MVPGTVNHADDTDYFVLDGVKGETYQVSITPDPGAVGAKLNIGLISSDGPVYTAIHERADNGDLVVTWEAHKTGQYYIPVFYQWYRDTPVPYYLYATEVAGLSSSTSRHRRQRRHRRPGQPRPPPATPTGRITPP